MGRVGQGFVRASILQTITDIGSMILHTKILLTLTAILISNISFSPQSNHIFISL